LARVVAVGTTKTKPRAAITAPTETAATTITAETAGAGSTVEVMAATVVGEEMAEVEGAIDRASSPVPASRGDFEA